MINFLHTFEPSAIALQLGPLTVHWYGITMVLGMLAAIVITQKLGRKYNISKDAVYDLAFYLVVFGLIGARLYAVLIEWRYFIVHPIEIIAVWNGGLAIHGGIIGGMLALWWWAKRKQLMFWKLADMLVPGIALGQAIGRWGNYFNQELFGTPTTAVWGIPIELARRPAVYTNAEYFHPTFLYESILNLINFGILVLLFAKQEKLRLHPGAIAFVYGINYAVIRIIMEQFRTDPTLMLFDWRLPILASFVLLIVGIAGLVYPKLTQRKR